eukprot:TRINITY_DN5158_c0_g3_i1.p1 TRINITY_DN5158_c0_g3~~TRINITY_DN5158_c0_g3_i1.p1  ORF type:complete len:126 (-),score=9.26 TRINITY_DN5158_c0_g3_i1:47-424(-)
MFSIPNKVENRQPEPQNIPKPKCSPKNVHLTQVKRIQAFWRGYYVRKVLSQQSALLKVVCAGTVGLDAVFHTGRKSGNHNCGYWRLLSLVFFNPKQKIETRKAYTYNSGAVYTGCLLYTSDAADE